MNVKRFLSKSYFEIGNFHLVFIADEGQKGQHLVLATLMLCEVKIKTQYTNTKEFNKEGPLNIG